MKLSLNPSDENPAASAVSRHSGTRGGFTLIEIALCLAIIAFALVAIIGVMPLGMTVQKDNRADTIINQDGMYWLNLLRGGSTGTVDLASFVTWVKVGTNPVQYKDTRDVIGWLSVPNSTNSARVRSISGSAVERNSPVGFDYILFTQIQPFTTTFQTNLNSFANLSSNLYDFRLILRYPALPNDSFGNGKKVFRSLVSGQMLATNSPVGPLYFFAPQILEDATLP